MPALKPDICIALVHPSAPLHAQMSESPDQAGLRKVACSWRSRLSRFPLTSANAEKLANPASLVEAIEELGQTAPSALGRASLGVRLLNLALMNREPLARLVLAFSVIEALGQDGKKWTPSQKAILSRLAKQAEDEESAEALEIAAVLRNLHPVSLRQGVRRVLERLNLSHLNKDWEEIYRLRSGVFHGTGQLADHELNKLAQDAITMCGQILIRLLQKEGITAPAIASRHYPPA